MDLENIKLPIITSILMMVVVYMYLQHMNIPSAEEEEKEGFEEDPNLVYKNVLITLCAGITTYLVMSYLFNNDQSSKKVIDFHTSSDLSGVPLIGNNMFLPKSGKKCPVSISRFTVSSDSFANKKFANPPVNVMKYPSVGGNSNDVFLDLAKFL